MEFSFSEEQLAFRRAVYEYAREEIVPFSEEYDAKAEFNWDAWRKMADYGLTGLPFPEEYGGLGAPVLTTMLASEALGHAGVDGGTSLALGAHTILCGVPIWLMGTEEQKKRYLTKIASGEWIGAMGLTEPGSGSDAAAMRTRAVRQGDNYILNGSKMFITNAPVANVLVVLAATHPEKRNLGISAFIIEPSFPGFAVGKDLNKMGNRTSMTSELIFDDCVVPAENLLGDEDLGFIQVGKQTLEWERSCMLAPYVGEMMYNLERSARYAKERVQFDQPIANFQAIQHKLADMKVAIEASRLLLYRVADMKDRGLTAMTEACIAKLFISENANRCAFEAVQIHGGYGYIHEYPAERIYRDVRISTIGAGTSEVQRMIIAKQLSKNPPGGPIR